MTRQKRILDWNLNEQSFGFLFMQVEYLIILVLYLKKRESIETWTKIYHTFFFVKKTFTKTSKKQIKYKGHSFLQFFKFLYFFLCIYLFLSIFVLGDDEELYKLSLQKLNHLFIFVVSNHFSQFALAFFCVIRCNNIHEYVNRKIMQIFRILLLFCITVR